MEKVIIVLPSVPIKKRTISQERLVRILIMEQMLEEERAAVIGALTQGRAVEPGKHCAWVRGGQLVVV